MKFQSDAERDIYDDFPKVTFLEYNLESPQTLYFLDRISENITKQDLKFRPKLHQYFGSSGF